MTMADQDQGGQRRTEASCSRTHPMGTAPFMWRVTLVVAALLAVLLGTARMDTRSGLGSDDGRDASFLNVIADLGAAGQELVRGCGGEPRDCCIAPHCSHWGEGMQPRLLQVGLSPWEEGRTDFERARLSGRSVLPETDPPKLA